MQPPSKTAQPERHRPVARSVTTATPLNQTPELDLKRLKEQIESDLRESLKVEIRQEMQRELERKQPQPNIRTAVTPRTEENYKRPFESTPAYRSIRESNGHYRNNTGDYGFSRAPGICWNCGIPGHLRRDCTLPPQTAGTVVTPRTPLPQKPPTAARGSKM